MSEKLPAPCERRNASGIFHGIACEGKGYRLTIVDGLMKNERPHWTIRAPRRTN